jgi:selenocysteine-specific elongation factor
MGAYPESQVRQVFDLLLREGGLIKVTEALYFQAETLDRLAGQVTDFIHREGEIHAQGFKQLTGLSRKFSIPLLEYFDKIKLTIRIDDKRVLRKATG